MAYASARTVDVASLPVIDLDPLMSGTVTGLERTAAALTDAAERVGFFYVTNHGVPASLIEEAAAVSRRFFDSPREAKATVAVQGRHRGWLDPGEAVMEGARRPDLKESFIWGIEVEPDDPALATNPLLAPNRWPAFLPALQPTLGAYLDAAHACGWQLLRAFAHALGVPPGHFIAHIDKPVSRGGTIYYPPQPATAGADQFGVAPHTDFGCLTLLWQDMVGGLQVQAHDGGWVAAPPLADCFVVNVGDLLARWTNDRFRSTPHRVVNTSGRSRQSIAVFVDPNAEQEVVPVCAEGEPARYPPVTVGEHIERRYNASFAYRQRQAQAQAQAQS
ncbi:MAG: isopenicillin N synthase family oxygenase [Geminicoccaceae bacterium]|nr:isopenicillin N synthase family oxygenase [Geminicoccaceae bacterium]